MEKYNPDYGKKSLSPFVDLSNVSKRLDFAPSEKIFMTLPSLLYKFNLNEEHELRFEND
jgi:hypothetical protein